jgi:hypothetical protein
MVPAGYLAKRVMTKPDWLGVEAVVDVCSLSGCVSKNFANYIEYWKHNGYWLFDSPQIIRQLAEEHSIDLSGTQLFYYEVYELEFHGDEKRWKPFEPAFPTKVVPPHNACLEGYDVVTFWGGSCAECSPLSCNSLAKEIKTNQHCLLGSLEEAKRLLEEGRFQHGEPGPYRIFAVFSVNWA